MCRANSGCFSRNPVSSGSLHDRAPAVFDRHDRRRARSAVERDFAEVLAGRELVQLHLAALVVRDVDARLAGQDDVERIGVVTLRDDDGSLGKGAHGRDRGDLVEQRLRQNLDRPVLHASSSPTAGNLLRIVRSHIGADKTPIRRRASRTR